MFKTGLSFSPYVQATAFALTAAFVAYHAPVAASLASSSASSTTCEAPTAPRCHVTVIPNSKLFVSEPDPSWFGNKGNPTDDPSWSNGNWLKSRFHFAFAEYRNPRNMNFGVMRVMNDDLVQPHRGFGTHGHSNMEILTYVVHGALTHQDSLGTKESLGRGSFQFMTAGTGVQHSEHNLGDVPLRFIQTWIVPRTRGLKPNYGSLDSSNEEQIQNAKNEMQHLVSSVDNTEATTPIKLNQDLDGYKAEMEKGKTVSMDLAEDRQAYLLCIEGGLEVNGKKLEKYDACEIMGGGNLEITATDVEETENGEVAHLLMYSMAKDGASGRQDIQ